MIAHAATPPLPPAVYAAARKPDQFADAGVFYSWIVETAQAPPPFVARASALLPEIAASTAARGWPHTPTERFAVARTVLLFHARGTTSDLCHFGPTMGRSWCGVVRSVRDRVTARFRVNVQAFEDGAIVMTRRRPS